MREICNCVFVSGRSVIDPQLVIVCKRVNNLRRKITWITFFSILTQISQRQHCTGFGLRRRRGPNDLVETLDTAMQSVLSVVDSQFVLNTIESKATFGNAISV